MAERITAQSQCEANYRAVLELIRDFDTWRAYGYTDEWTEAMAFTYCQEAAGAVLSGEPLPPYPERRVV